jgi:hypothetical protein
MQHSPRNDGRRAGAETNAYLADARLILGRAELILSLARERRESTDAEVAAACADVRELMQQVQSDLVEILVRNGDPRAIRAEASREALLAR